MVETMADNWVEVAKLEDIPPLLARVVKTKHGDIALFHAGDGNIYALENKCPHEGGPLSEGIIHDCRVACPLHNWVIDLKSGEATGPDEGKTRTFEVKVENGAVYLKL
jgi:nitrite reductase (NADH) small subunit